MSGQHDDRRQPNASRRPEVGNDEWALDRALIARLHRVGASLDRSPESLRARIAAMLDEASSERPEPRT